MAEQVIYDEAELLAEIAAGDGRAFKTIYERYYNKIYQFAYRLLLSAEAAEEVVQETMLLLWQSGEKLKKIEKPEAYLKTVAKRKTIAMFRRNAIEARAVNELTREYTDSNSDTEEGILLKEGRRILEQGIDRLPQQQRLVYQLCYQEGLKYEEVAERLNIAPGTVQSHMKQALKSLRNHLSSHANVIGLLVVFRLF